MKKHFFLLAIMLGMATWILPEAEAQGNSRKASQVQSKKASKNKKKAAAKEDEQEAADTMPNPVGDLLAQNKYLTEATPNCKAQYYIFLRSASWCGPCNKEMPEVVKAYELMKQTGKVELILISADRSADDAKGFLTKYGASFPAVMPASMPKLPTLPPSNGIPNATIVKADGTVVKTGHGSLIRSWKSLTIGEFAIIGDDGVTRVPPALKDIKFTNGKPSLKAKYYVYYYFPQLDQATPEIIAKINDEYKEMKKEKVELIFITTDKSLAGVGKTLKKYKSRFPAMLTSKASELPGISGTDTTTPRIDIVTRSGATAASGDASTIGNWKKVIEANK